MTDSRPFYWPIKPTAPRRKPRKPRKIKPKKETTDLLGKTYSVLRADCVELEELIAGANDWSEKDLKRLDKAVTVMKVGFKLVKRVLKSRAKVEAEEPVEVDHG